MRIGLSHSAERYFKALSLLAFGFVCFMGGALATFYHGSVYDLIHEADIGHSAWQQKMKTTAHGRKHSSKKHKSPKKQANPKAGTADKMGPPTVTREAGTYDGYTFVATRVSSHAYLYDMDGKRVHEWHIPFSQIWPDPPQISHAVNDGHVYWRNAYLYPNGDLLAVHEALGDTPYGYGLAKIDKDSHLIWRYSENAHHWVDVAQDGTIYGLIQHIARYPIGDMRYLPPAIIEDFVVKLSPEGKELDRLSLPDAMLHSSYRHILKDKFDSPRKKHATKGDILHTNAVSALRPDMAGAFPMFKPGQLLVSLRNISTIIVVDLKERKIVWAAQGPWKMQHAVQFAPDGTIIMFDNQGGGAKHSRVLKYNPATKETTIVYEGTPEHPFATPYFGTEQVLPNHNTLIAEGMKGRVLEVTPDQKIVWQFVDQYSSNKKRRILLTTAKRFTENQLPFMKKE